MGDKHLIFKRSLRNRKSQNHATAHLVASRLWLGEIYFKVFFLFNLHFLCLIFHSSFVIFRSEGLDNARGLSF